MAGLLQNASHHELEEQRQWGEKAALKLWAGLGSKCDLLCNVGLLFLDTVPSLFLHIPPKPRGWAKDMRGKARPSFPSVLQTATMGTSLQIPPRIATFRHGERQSPKPQCEHGVQLCLKVTYSLSAPCQAYDSPLKTRL